MDEIARMSQTEDQLEEQRKKGSLTLHMSAVPKNNKTIKFCINKKVQIMFLSLICVVRADGSETGFGAL